VPLTRRTDTGDPHSATAGWEAIYPSKRMEAYREGVEDYLYLYLLGQLADKAQASGLAGEAQQARALRQQAIDAVVADRGKYETIRHYRERLGEMIESLAGKVGGSAPQSRNTHLLRPRVQHPDRPKNADDVHLDAAQRHAAPPTRIYTGR
jgi:hypothetical protein